MAFLAAAAPILGLAGTVFSAAGSIENGFYQGQVAKNNATIAGQNAQYAEQAGTEQATNAAMKGAAQGAAIKNAQAANGIDVNSGSAVDVQESQRETSQLDAETVLNNANLEAYGYTTQAINDEAQSKQDEIGGVIGGAGDILSGASSIGLKWGSIPAGGGVSGG